MSIYFDFEVPLTGRRFRRAVDEDKIDIELFWNRSETETLFCATNIGELIELSTLAICMVDEEMTVLGFMALSDFPPLPGVHPSSWEIWMRNMFQKFYLSRNTIFIHFMCCTDAVSEFFLEEALTSVFMNDFYLQQIILVVQPNCGIDCMTKYPTFRRRSVFKHCYKSKEEDVEKCIALYVAVRQDFCPKLKVREAVEEDNDEVVEILDSTSEKLKEMYGEFYISELLSRHPESNRTIIVAETPTQTQDKVVGVMCLNEDINYVKLQQTYELAPYRGLMVTSYIEREQIRRGNALLKTFGDPIMTGKWSPFDRVNTEKVVGGPADELSREHLPREKTSSKIQFRKPAHLRKSDSPHQPSFEAKFGPLIPDRSLFYLMDDEPLEYEIVNIDTKDLILQRESCNEMCSLEMSPTRLNLNRIESSFRTNIKRKISLPTIIPKKEELLFTGKPNAFSIELFGIRDDIDERYAFDLLEAAFELMGDYDYCIIRIPTSQKSFALLHHFCFVPTRSNICSDYALYVAHRNSVLGKLRIRKAEFADIPQITTLFHNLDGKETMWTVERGIVTSKNHHAYVFLCGTSIIGVGILDPPEHVTMLRTKFMIDSFQRHRYHMASHGIEGGVTMVKTVLAYQVFEPHFAFFAREMLRLSSSTTLVWLTAYRNKWVANKANALVSVMTPLPYRVTGDSGLLPEMKQVHDLSKRLISFSAWFLCKKMTSIPRLCVDTRIVVVGASKTAIAFLFSLLFADTSTYLTFTNVTLVSTYGLPYLRRSFPEAEMMFPKCNCTSDRFLKSTPFTYYVNVVQGTMVAINRQDKYIVTDSNVKIAYDMLFLLIGKQYQHPQYMGSLVERENLIKAGKFPQYVRMDNPNHSDAQLEPPVDLETPANVFYINTLAEASHALKSVKNFNWEHDERNFKVCVYGSGFDAYCCISGLLEIDVRPESIVFVDAFPPENETKPRVSIFCNTRVDETVQQILDSLQIKTYHGYYFDSWMVDDTDLVVSVDFVSNFKFLRVDCCAFFYYGKKDVNPHAFVALNKCGVAYDGGILIDHKFQTNDPAIHAAGPATRYFRRYMEHDKIQKFYNPREVGQKLGEQIRNQLDPVFTEPDKGDKVGVMKCRSGIFAGPVRHRQKTVSDFGDTELPWDSDTYKLRVPKFKKPRVWYCMLPGNLQYLEVRPPGPAMPHYYTMSTDYTGYIIETFKSGYFKLHLSNQYVVDGITCLTPAKYSIQNFKKLYGLSAVVLNNVHLRYSAGKIDDLYEFFMEPWSGLFYNEKPEELLTIVKHLKPKNQPYGETMEEMLDNFIDSSKDVSKLDAKLRVRSNFEKLKYFEVIADYVIVWLTDNDILFPMYMTPHHVTEYAAECANLPPFKRHKSSMKKMLAMILK